MPRPRQNEFVRKAYQCTDEFTWGVTIPESQQESERIAVYVSLPLRSLSLTLQFSKRK